MGTGKKAEGSKGGGGRLHWRVQWSTSSPESVAGGGWFEVLWNLECPVGLSQRKEGNVYLTTLSTHFIYCYMA